MRTLKDLNANQRNPRKISNEKLELLTSSIYEFGDLGGIIYNVNLKRLVGGHQRKKALPEDAEIIIEREFNPPTPAGTVAEGHVKLGTETMKYREVSWDDTKDIAANIAANKHGGDFDLSILTEQLLDLDASNYEMGLTGFTDAELEDLMAPLSKEGLVEDDEAPELQKGEAKSQLGNIYKLGDHRLMCGDSTDEQTVAYLMDGQKADMIFTDPPYGVDYEVGHNAKKRTGIQGDKLEGEGLTNLFGDALANAEKHSHDHAAFYIWYANGKAVETFASFANLDLKVRAVICWYKIKSGLGAFMSQYIPNYEPCIYAHKTGEAPQWFGPTDEKTVWELKKEQKNEFHPTQKPVELPERAISNSSKSGDIILDLFGGSGSTLIAAEKKSRYCYMMEFDPHYVDVIIARWEKFTGNKAELLNG